MASDKIFCPELKRFLKGVSVKHPFKTVQVFRWSDHVLGFCHLKTSIIVRLKLRGLVSDCHCAHLSFWNGSHVIPMQRGLVFTKIIIP